jgi:hypothetical protein
LKIRDYKNPCSLNIKNLILIPLLIKAGGVSQNNKKMNDFNEQGE